MTELILPEKLIGVQQLRQSYDVLLCDVWGVIHNGINLFAGVEEALVKWRQNGGHVVLLTNAPRPATTVQKRLDSLGLSREAYDDILSSGDAARDMLQERAAENQSCHFVGAGKDTDLVAGIDIEFTDVEEADFILLTGMEDDTIETPEDYADAIKNWRQHNLTLICANPDRVVQIGDKVMYCAGALAEIYEQQGGRVIWLGKPYGPIYQTAAKRVARLSDCPKHRVLAIGDGHKTDIAGANHAGYDVLYVTGGLAETLENPPETPEQAAQFLNQHDAFSRYFMKHLVW
ncbi:MAG: TIGR01459 family HAD-type hydrolase [Parvibaculales bacterium]